MNKLRVNKLTMITFYIVLTVIAIIQVYPFFWVITSSFKTAEQLASTPAYSLPQQLFMGNYERAMQSNLPRYFLNSIVVAVCVLAALVIISAPVAFALSKLRFRQSEKVMSFFLFGMMIPVFSCLIPIFRVYNALGIRNTYWALIIPQVGFGLPMCIYLYKNFMERIPDSLVEAAEIDGCTQGQFFFRIALPLSAAITAILVLYYGVGHWNAYFSALVYISDSEKYPLQLVLRNILITNETALSQTATTEAARAALREKQELIIICIIPVLLLYPFIQKDFVKGVMIGSLKG